MPSSLQIQQATTVIQNGGVISYPTESVFGLGCDPLSEKAVYKILGLKKRSVDKGLIIIAASLEQLLPYIEISETNKQKLLNNQSAITWLVKKSNLTPSWLSGQHKKIAIRVSTHPLVINLCNELKHPIISTSANPAGASPALSSEQSQIYFSNQVDLYLDSSSSMSKQATQIKDIETDLIIR